MTSIGVAELMHFFDATHSFIDAVPAPAELGQGT